MERLIDTAEFRKFRDHKLYKLVDLFWTDDQKSCILENSFIFGVFVVSKIKYLRNELLDGNQLFVIKTDNRYFLVLREKDSSNLILAGQGENKVVTKKVGVFQQWVEMEFPAHIVEMMQI